MRHRQTIKSIPGGCATWAAGSHPSQWWSCLPGAPPRCPGPTRRPRSSLLGAEPCGEGHFNALQGGTQASPHRSVARTMPASTPASFHATTATPMPGGRASVSAVPSASKRTSSGSALLPWCPAHTAPPAGSAPGERRGSVGGGERAMPNTRRTLRRTLGRVDSAFQFPFTKSPPIST